MREREVVAAHKELRKIIADSVPSPRKPGDPLLYYPEAKLAGWACRHGMQLVEDNIRLRKQISRLKEAVR